MNAAESFSMAMADHHTECCMCGDVGFPDKLFQCIRCLSRFQHSYCSNYYQEEPSETTGLCDWCRSEERNSSRHGSHPKKPAAGKEGNRSDYSGGERIKQSDDREEGGSRGKNAGGSSAKPTGRRYKLLKDVLC